MRSTLAALVALALVAPAAAQQPVTLQPGQTVTVSAALVKPDTVPVPGPVQIVHDTVPPVRHDTLWCSGTVCQPTPPAPPGIAVRPGESIQAAVNANPPGTVFRLKAGRHLRQSVVPKSRDAFSCEVGAVLDGQNVTANAFKGVAGVDGVRIAGCGVTAYAPPAQMGAILVTGYDTLGGKAWIIDSNDVGYNANGGIRAGARTTVRGNNVHHNGQMGITGTGEDLVIDGNEIAFNNPAAAGLGFEAGGTKFALTNRLVLRNNFVHHNQGPGLWADIGNRNFLIEGNRSEDNLQDGIAIEISQGPGVIRNNTLRRNGLGDIRRINWPWGAGIGVHSSGGVEVYGNTLEGNAHGIALIQQKRGCSYPKEPPCTLIDPVMYVHDAYVHDNTVTAGTGTVSVAGGVTDAGENAFFTSRKNRFVGNTYRGTAAIARPFPWMNGWRTAIEWKAFGQDSTGSIQ